MNYICMTYLSYHRENFLSISQTDYRNNFLDKRGDISKKIRGSMSK